MSGAWSGHTIRHPRRSWPPCTTPRALEARTGALSAAPLDRWWEGFRDPVLTRVVQRALDQNLDLAAALARVDQARAGARAAGAQRLPSGDLTAQVAPLRQSLDSPIGSIGRHLPGYKRDQTLYDVGAGASWEIDLFGALRRGAEAASAQAQAAQAEQLGIQDGTPSFSTPYKPPWNTMELCRSTFGAGNETRTRDLNLGKVALYQLSYSRVNNSCVL